MTAVKKAGKNQRMGNLSSDPRQQAILESAWKAFSAYGFRKTSMDDIARGAGISRPALYLHYRNKEDIFRTLAQYLYAASAQAVRDVLSRGGAVPDVLAAAFDAQAGEFAKVFLTSPHGMELMDAGFATSMDIVNEGEAHVTAIYADWLEAEAKAGRVRLTGTAQEVAATMTSALKGIKTTTPDHPTYVARVAQLARLFGTALAA